MAHTIVTCADIVILIGVADSNIVKRSEQYDDAETICIAAPAAAEAGTIQISFDGVNFFPLQDQTPANVAYPTAGNARNYDGLIAIAAPFFKLHITAGNAAAQRNFKMSKRVHLI